MRACRLACLSPPVIYCLVWQLASFRSLAVDVLPQFRFLAGVSRGSLMAKAGLFLSVFLVFSIVAGKASAQEAQSVAEPDFDAMKSAAENKIRSKLVDPSSAQFEWPHGFIEGTWPTILKKVKYDGWITCGKVNARNRMGGYTGLTYFVAVLSNNSVVYADIGSADGRGWTNQSCARSTSVFPSPQFAVASEGSKSLSIADELSKLAELRQQGVLTDEEFQTQKQRLLSNGE